MTHISISVGRAQPKPSTTTLMSEYDRRIQALLKQKGRIEEEQAKVKASQELDSKIKAERLKSLTTEQQTIEAQIAQIRMEQAQNRKNGVSPSAESRDPKPGRLSDTSMKDIVRADSLHGQLKKMTQVRGELEAAANNLQSEVRLGRLQFELGPANDSGRGQMLENAEQSVFKPKLEQETALKAQIAGLDGKIGERWTKRKKLTERRKRPTKRKTVPGPRPLRRIGTEA
ncbi:hypothetical protein Elgi_20350 [Paenibacillus elgii]|nr:hypothetical protein Elgi_20350 [Paenibacillus elgii]